MSFSNDIKNELLRLPVNDDSEKVALLAGLARMDGRILIGTQRKISLQLNSENAAVARLAFSWLKELFHVEADVTIQRMNRLKKNVLYVVNVPSQTRMPVLLNSLGMVDRDGLLFRPEIAEDLISSDSLRRAYLRGIFLGGGSMTDPLRSYHLEIVTQSEEFAGQLIDLIKNYNIYPRMSTRKENVIVYLKESEQISDFLALLGAFDALMALENTRIQKNVRNQVNRLVNCETANLNKSIDAAQRQIQSIHLIKETVGLQSLTDSLRQAAEARLNHPEESLKDLGQLLDPPVGKSGMNHRMRRLEEIAEQIQADAADTPISENKG
ncbi:MAG: DNA-binding protein WhiA [Peptococcaceae bacterium]|nr:DNA-binding protein WhiA [Peptococcaceae bacterium]